MRAQEMESWAGPGNEAMYFGEYRNLDITPPPLPSHLNLQFEANLPAATGAEEEDKEEQQKCSSSCSCADGYDHIECQTRWRSLSRGLRLCGRICEVKGGEGQLLQSVT